MGSSFKRVLGLFTALVYPPLCLHCHCLLETPSLLCSLCFEQLPLIDPNERCRTCFLELGKGGCKRCKSRKKGIHSQMAALELLGPAKTLLRCVEEGDVKAIAAAAALMAYHWLQREHPMPDYIVPLPLHWTKKYFVDRDPRLLLGSQIATLLGVPLASALKLQYDLYGSPVFTLKKPLADKHLLLIAPQLNDTLFRNAALSLQVGYPARVEGLALSLWEERS